MELAACHSLHTWGCHAYSWRAERRLCSHCVPPRCFHPEHNVDWLRLWTPLLALTLKHEKPSRRPPKFSLFFLQLAMDPQTIAKRATPKSLRESASLRLAGLGESGWLLRLLAAGSSLYACCGALHVCGIWRLASFWWCMWPASTQTCPGSMEK